jgi:glycosyltransferase involved in cell wall biosynthesis
MTAYNTEKYISQAIDSILLQTFSDFELIIVDDGSTDKTVQIIESYKDRRIRLYKLGSNKGVGYANQFALSNSKGEYVAKVDSDDIIESTRFQEQIDFLEQNSHIAIVDSFVEYFSEDKSVLESDRYNYYKKIKTQHINQMLSPEELCKQIYIHCIIIHGAMMARREIIKSAYNFKFKIAEDYAVFYELNKQGYLFYKLPKVLTRVRISTNSTTARFSDEYFESIFSIKLDEIKRVVTMGSRPFAIWGASKLGQQLKELLQMYLNVSPDIFIDSFSTKKRTTDFIPVKRPNQVQLKSYNIIVASSPGKLEILKSLENKGMKFMQDFIVFI